MNGKCINIVANLWNSLNKNWKTGALAIGSSEACMLGGVAAWLRWRKKRQAQGKPFDKPDFVIQPVSRWYGKNSPNCGRLKCVKCL